GGAGLWGVGKPFRLPWSARRKPRRVGGRPAKRARRDQSGKDGDPQRDGEPVKRRQEREPSAVHARALELELPLPSLARITDRAGHLPPGRHFGPEIVRR